MMRLFVIWQACLKAVEFDSQFCDLAKAALGSAMISKQLRTAKHEFISLSLYMSHLDRYCQLAL